MTFWQPEQESSSESSDFENDLTLKITSPQLTEMSITDNSLSKVPSLDVKLVVLML